MHKKIEKKKEKFRAPRENRIIDHQMTVWGELWGTRRTGEDFFLHVTIEPVQYQCKSIN